MNSKLKDKSTLGYLGQAFQLKFLGQLLTDKKYASSVIDLVKPEYFDDEKIRYLQFEEDSITCLDCWTSKQSKTRFFDKWEWWKFKSKFERIRRESNN